MTALQGVRLAGLLVAGALALAAQGPRKAQELQAGKPIRLIVGLSPGGGTDVTARLIAQQMTANTGMTVLVENKAGGNFIPALMEVARAAPDGHTLYFSSTSSLITQALHPDYPYDLRKFTAISEVATGPLILVVRNDLGVKSVKELIALAKQKPGTIRFGVGGGVGQFARRQHRSAADSRRHQDQHGAVSRSGSGAQRPARRAYRRDDRRHAGDVGAGKGGQGHAACGHRHQALGLAARRADHAGVGLPDLCRDRLVRHVRPARHAAAIAQKLRDEAAKAIGPKEVVETLAKQGMEPRGTQPAEYAKYMEQEFAFYSKIIKDADIKPPQ